MAAFASLSAAELRAKQKGPSGDNTWVNAHAARSVTGAFIVRFQRFLTKAAQSSDQTRGSWIETNDDTVT